MKLEDAQNFVGEAVKISFTFDSNMPVNSYALVESVTKESIKLRLVYDLETSIIYDDSVIEPEDSEKLFSNVKIRKLLDTEKYQWMDSVSNVH